MIVVLLCDSQALILEGLSKMISGDSSYKLLTHHKLDDIIEIISLNKPQLLIIDPYMASHGVDLLQQLKSQFPDLRFLALSNNVERISILRIFNLGILCYLSKSANQKELFSGIRAALKGERYVCDCVDQQLLSEGLSGNASTEAPHLSAREKEIIHLIAEGVPDKEIAEKLFVSYHTIRTHRKNIAKKIGFSFKNTAELALLIDYLLKNAI